MKFVKDWTGGPEIHSNRAVTGEMTEEDSAPQASRRFHQPAMRIGKATETTASGMNEPQTIGLDVYGTLADPLANCLCAPAIRGEPGIPFFRTLA